VLTGGLNVCLPLVRYATGDFAAMDFPAGAMPRLVGFEGRSPILFRSTAGEWFSGVDVSTSLGPLSLPFVSVHQRADGSVLLRTSGDEATLRQAAEAVRRLFGADVRVDLEPVERPTLSGKPICYSTELSAPL
jgi:phenylacetate-CoA ligase